MGFALSEMQLTSAAFSSGGVIPSKHTGEGEDISPALSWTSAPEGTKSYVVVCHDPDAPLLTPKGYGFVHWVLYGIPGNVVSLAEATTDYTQGTNDFGHAGYGGPMPPEGHGVHNYFFWVMALDAALDLPSGLSMLELFERIEPHCTAMNRLVGTYQRG